MQSTQDCNDSSSQYQEIATSQAVLPSYNSSTSCLPLQVCLSFNEGARKSESDAIWEGQMRQTCRRFVWGLIDVRCKTWDAGQSGQDHSLNRHSLIVLVTMDKMRLPPLEASITELESMKSKC